MDDSNSPPDEGDDDLLDIEGIERLIDLDEESDPDSEPNFTTSGVSKRQRLRSTGRVVQRDELMPESEDMQVRLLSAHSLRNVANLFAGLSRN